jgi:hypothetical protein
VLDSVEALPELAAEGSAFAVANAKQRQKQALRFFTDNLSLANRQQGARRMVNDFRTLFQQ